MRIIRIFKSLINKVVERLGYAFVRIDHQADMVVENKDLSVTVADSYASHDRDVSNDNNMLLEIAQGVPS